MALHCSRALLEHGVSGLALLDLPASFHDKDAQTAISQLRADFLDARILTAGVDVTDSESVVSGVQQMRSDLGPLRILCCFAGVVSATAAEDTAPEEWKRVMDVNTTGTWFTAQAVGKYGLPLFALIFFRLEGIIFLPLFPSRLTFENDRHMISDGLGGRIVLISSISGHRVNYPQPQVAYNTSKSAILHMRASLAAEWARYGIRVNSISPGYMDTVLNEGDALEPFREVWASRNPVGRIGVPAELTGPLVMLCSDVGGSYVNGADIVVDGTF